MKSGEILKKHGFLYSQGKPLTRFDNKYYCPPFTPAVVLLCIKKQGR